MDGPRVWRPGAGAPCAPLGNPRGQFWENKAHRAATVLFPRRPGVAPKAWPWAPGLGSTGPGPGPIWNPRANCWFGGPWGRWKARLLDRGPLGFFLLGKNWRQVGALGGPSGGPWGKLGTPRGKGKTNSWIGGRGPLGPWPWAPVGLNQGPWGGAPLGGWDFWGARRVTRAGGPINFGNFGRPFGWGLNPPGGQAARAEEHSGSKGETFLGQG